MWILNALSPQPLNLQLIGLCFIAPPACKLNLIFYLEMMHQFVQQYALISNIIFIPAVSQVYYVLTLRIKRCWSDPLRFAGQADNTLR